MENVPGLVGKRGRELVSAFEKEMAAAGYCVEAVMVNAAEYGVPQTRRRVIYYGWRQEEAPFRLPGPSHSENEFVSAWDAIGELPSPPEDLTPHPSDELHRRTRLSPLNQRRIELIPPGGGMQDLPVELRVDCHKNGADRIGHRYVYGRLARDKPAATITARFDSFTRGKFGHPREPRNITLREGARLQTFPDRFRFSGTQEEIAAQIGNAVPPLLAEVLGRAVVMWLDGDGPADRVHSPLQATARQLSLFDVQEWCGA
jgi:DNA (cytosine-5)-methyltransferase 1